MKSTIGCLSKHGLHTTIKVGKQVAETQLILQILEVKKWSQGDGKDKFLVSLSDGAAKYKGFFQDSASSKIISGFDISLNQMM